MIYHLTRASRHLIFWGLISFALCLTAVRLLLGSIELYRSDLEAKISSELAAPVKIASLGAGMRGFRPALVLKNVNVLSPSASLAPVIHVKEIRVSIDLLELLRHQPLLTSAWVTLIGAELSVIRHPDGHIAIAGITSNDDSPPLWLLQGERFEILQSQVSWQDLKPSPPMTNTPALQVFTAVNISLKNTGNDQHLLNMLLQLPEQQGEALQVSMQLRGNFLAANALNGQVYVQAKQLALPQLLKDRLPEAIRLLKGKGDVQLWSDWQNSQVQAMTAKLQFQELTLQHSGYADLTLHNLHAHLNALYKDGQWRMHADHLVINSDALQILNAKFALQFPGMNEFVVTQIAAELPSLQLSQLHALQPFIGDFLPASTQWPKLQGQLRQFSFRFQPQQQRFAILGDLQDFGIAATDSSPSINHVNAHIYGNEVQGTLELKAHQSSLNLPQTFPQALEIKALQTRLSWQQNTQGWLLSTPLLALDVPDIQAKSDLQLQIQRDTYATEINLLTRFEGDTDVRNFGQYFPTKLMGADTEKWLAKAFVQGRARPRGVILKGALADFPFSKNQGVFELILDMNHIELDYAPGWEHVKDLSLEAVFYQAGMFITAQGHAEALKLEDFAINIPSFETSQYLTITGKGKGQFPDIFNFLKQSPVREKVSAALEVLSAQGAAMFDLDIKIPLLKRLEQTIQGRVVTENARLNVLPIDLPITALRGTLNFDATGLTAGNYQAVALGYPIKAVLNSSADKMSIVVNGHSDLLQLQQQFKWPDLEFVDGESAYQLDLDLPTAKNLPVSLKLSSDLVGVQVKLPDILAKNAASSSNLSVRIQLGDTKLMPLTVDYAQKLQAACKVDVHNKSLAAIKMLVGEGEMPSIPSAGKSLDINLQNVALSEWLGLAADDGNTPAQSQLFEQINLHGRHLFWQQQDTGPVAVNMQLKQNMWQVAVESSLLSGTIRKPLAGALDQAIQLDLEYLDLSKLAQQNAAHAPVLKAHSSQHSRLPLFNIHSQQLLWQGIDLGVLTLNTQRIVDGLQFPEIKLQNAKGELAFSGSWHYDRPLPITQANGQLTMQGFGEYLAKLDLTHDLKGAQALINFNVQWQGSPQDFALKNLNGSLDVQVENGRILSIEPGFGRVLGFLAMEQWGRRLRLDFSDLYAQGLMVNSIQGAFTLQQGIANSQLVKIDAIPAEILLKGSMDLSARTLEQHVTVLPKSSAALPIAGTIVDKVLTFAAETLTGNSQEGFLLGSEFQLRGTWQNPIATQLHENSGLLQKTWHRLTDFSWLH